ncbi:hypothetical protein RND81_14G021500 [Saponaria officinalis]|uniref:Leucine-rich repeat-containing N-terminal plant-type domain-containing protein n=1 Tax=Saponaria officinalis TaxID=3572 RepID=A0AAW1GK25_SAPOF
MRKACFLFVIVLLQIFQSSLCVHAKELESLGFIRCKKHELEALLKFKQSFTEDPLNRLSSWVGDDCCQWLGVTCDNVTYNVVKLNLRSQSQYVCLPDSTVSLQSSGVSSALLELKLLTHLDLSGNNFSGSRIPEFIGSFKHLRYLNLSNAGFSSPLPPQLGNLANLVHLDLNIANSCSDIALDSDGVGWASGLLKLQSLDMSGYNLSLAHDTLKVLNTLPALSALSLSECELDNSHLSEALLGNTSNSFFPTLQHLDLHLNGFEGPLPSVLKDMVSLRSLYLGDNVFNGSVPLWLRAMRRLEALDLSNNGFNYVEGGITSDSFLPTLQHLDLQLNAFEGPLPSVLKDMVSLRSLSLSGNHFNGSVPLWLRAMRRLEALDLSSNGFNYVEGGIIMGIMGNPCNFKYLDLSFNSISQEDIIEPSMSLSRCGAFELEYLALGNNNINGSLPSLLGQFTNLNYLDLSQNDLRGSVPNFIGNLTEIEYLNISSNSLQGTLFGIGNLSKLSYLDMSYNNLILNIDSSFNWRPPFQLQVFSVHSCVINTVFPQWLRNQTQIQYLDLSNTGISGELPGWLWNLSNLLKLHLSDNKLTGSLPQHIAFDGHYPRCNLMRLDLHNNLLTGTIPKWLGNLGLGEYEIEVIDLSSNLLSGAIFEGNNASSLFYIPNSLMVLDLGDNMLSGEIQFGKEAPYWGVNLEILNLRGNHFNGPIPSQICELHFLLVLELAHNRLTGHIPPCLGSIPFSLNVEEGSISDTSLQIKEIVKGIVALSTGTKGGQSIIDLSSNNLVGTIPEELTNISALFALNLSFNHLTGHIPENIGNFKTVESLDLSNNHLSGTIPQSLASISWISNLNLSNNNLHGPIPTGRQLQTLDDPSIYAGNSGLCGFPLPNNCTKPDPPPSLTNVNPGAGKDEVEKEDKYEKLWFILAVMSGVATGFWGVVITLVIKRSWRESYFRYVEDVADRIYVPIKVRVNRFKRRFDENS